MNVINTSALPASLKAQFADMTKPRGIRNNNPLNIRVNAFMYKGQIPLLLKTDKFFKQFYTIGDGFFSAYRLLVNSYVNKGYNTLEKLLNRYAPKADNNKTDQYIKVVANKVGINPTDIIKPNDKQLFSKLLAAMATVENGVTFTPNEVLKYI